MHRDRIGRGFDSARFGRLILACLMVSLAAPAIPAPALEQRRQFLEAEAALQQGQIEQAKEKMKALDGYPLQPHLLARILLQEPLDEPGVQAFLRRYGNSRYAAALRDKWLQRLADRGDWQRFLADYRDAGVSEANRCRRLWALLQTGAEATVHRETAELWDTGRRLPPACAEAVAQWRASPDYSEEHYWRRFGALLESDRVDEARDLLELAPPGARGRAESWLRLHLDPGRAEWCDAVTSGDPLSGRIFAHAMQRLAKTQPERAMAIWSLRQSELGLSPDLTAVVDRRLALALARRRSPAAAAYLHGLDEDDPDADLGGWRVRAALANADWPLAWSALRRLADGERQRPVWRYWLARVEARLGDDSAAAKTFMAMARADEYYGLLAAERAGRELAVDFGRSDPTVPGPERLLASPTFQGVAEFLALQRPGEAQREWAEAVAQLPSTDLPAAAALAATWGWYRQALAILAKLGSGRHLGLRYPLPYADSVQQEAARFALDPALIFAIIRRESAFDPGARSPVGALGLMQLMPATGAEMAKRLGERWESDRVLLQPARNIRYGSGYFRRLLDRFGHLALAAAGYNAGPARAERWQPRVSSVPADLWIESIPFDETRNYVMAVLGSVALYRSRLRQEPPRLLDLLPDIPVTQQADRPRVSAVSALACR